MPELNAGDLQPLWDYMSEQHDLYLTFTELFDILGIIEEIQEKNKPHTITFKVPTVNPFDNTNK